MKTITIPAGLTAKKIIKDCKNKTKAGTPVLYSISWYEKEAFYTSEVTRGGTYEILTLEQKGKSWNECNEIATKENTLMFNFAELLYIMVEHEKQTGERLLGGWEYSWTSSRDSDGGLVDVGSFDSEGALVGSDSPGNSRALLGVCFSRMSVGDMNTESVSIAEASSRSELEARVQKLEEWKDSLNAVFRNIPTKQ